jgi:hypothetical protein
MNKLIRKCSVSSIPYNTKEFDSAVFYYESPVDQALMSVNNPYDLREIVTALECPIRPDKLKFSVSIDKSIMLDASGKILHREFSLDLSGNVLQKDIDSPFHSKKECSDINSPNTEYSLDSSSDTDSSSLPSRILFTPDEMYIYCMNLHHSIPQSHTPSQMGDQQFRSDQDIYNPLTSPEASPRSSGDEIF